MAEKYRGLLVQFIKFGIVGVSNTAVSLAVYYALCYIGAHYIAANFIGFTLGALNSYYWNNKYVFKRSGGHVRTFAKMYAGCGATFFLGSALLALQVEYLGVSEYLAPLVNIPITTVINFAVNKLWVFKKS